MGSRKGAGDEEVSVTGFSVLWMGDVEKHYGIRDCIGISTTSLAD